MEEVKGGAWTMKKVIGVFVAIILTAFMINWIYSPLVVTVTGTGELTVPASSATISLTVTATDATVRGAIEQTKARSANLRQVLRANLIEEKDIMESQVTAVPAAAYTAGASGFQASLNLGATTSDVNGVDNLVAALYNAGAAVVAQPVLSADKQEELEAKALDQAMADAKKQAAGMARQNWKLIKKIVSITQASSGSTATVTTKAESLGGNEFKIAKAVQVVYKMW